MDDFYNLSMDIMWDYSLELQCNVFVYFKIMMHIENMCYFSKKHLINILVENQGFFLFLATIPMPNKILSMVKLEKLALVDFQILILKQVMF